MAPQRKKARETKEDELHSAEAEAAAEPETEQEEMDQRREDTDVLKRVQQRLYNTNHQATRCGQGPNEEH